MTLISRRLLLAAVPALAVSTRLAGRGTAPDYDAIERRSGGKLGFFAVDVQTGRTTGWRTQERFPFCSAFKVPLAAYTLWKAERGALRLNAGVPYTETDILSYAPLTRPALAHGGLSIEALCHAAVTFSDNTAANLLLRETGGPAALTAWMREQSDSAFVLGANEPGLNLARYGDRRNTTTPAAMAASYCRFILGGTLRPASRDKLAKWMIASTTGNKRLRAGLPTAWRAGDKTGTFNEGHFSTVDIAVAWRPNRSPIVMAGFVTDTPDMTSGERALVDAARQVALWTG